MNPPITQRTIIADPNDPRLHPQLRALWRYCDELRAGRPALAVEDITPFVLRPWLGSIVLADRIEGDDFRYRLYGSNLVEAFGFDLTGRRVSACEPQIGPLPLEEYRRVATTFRAEATVRGSPAAREWLLMDKLALPLVAAEGGPVTRILAAIYTSEAEGQAAL